jgi:hypothetical protein
MDRRRLGRLLPLFVLALVLPFIEPYTLVVRAQTTAFSVNEPTSIDFGFRLKAVDSDPPNEPRMLVTRPWDGNPRQLLQRDADATLFSVRATLPDRPSNTVKFVDSVAAIPAVVGTQGEQTTPGGFHVNDILVTQGFNVYTIPGAGTPPPQVTPAFLTSIPTSGANPTQCTSTSTDILVDRWALPGGFGGAAIVTCYRPPGPGPRLPVYEVWKITKTNSTVSIGLLTRLFEQITGRADFTSPNFAGCGGCLAVAPDTLIPGGGNPLSSRISLGNIPNGRRHTISVSARVYGFIDLGTGDGCLFGTVPSQNTIKKFDCSANPAVFPSTSPGDLLVFTSTGSVLRISYANTSNVFEVANSVGTYEDLAFPSLRLVSVVIQQPSVPNPNFGTNNVVFYIESSTGFNPQTDVNVSTLRFGRTGSEPSVTGCNDHVGTDTNNDGVPDLKCSADLNIAMCGGPVLCIVTGFTYNQAGFRGD